MSDSADYYARKLSQERLRKCYEIAPPRVRRYLEAELRHVCEKLRPSDIVLELGCGYGRALAVFADKAGAVVGIDSSLSSLELVADVLKGFSNHHVLAMDAVSLGFANAAFDVVVCIQNGISAFKVDQRDLIRESVRVTRPGGTVLFSTYAERFWDDRLEWFELQAAHGLIGEIDRQQTHDGNIVCRDGFKATTVGPGDFLSLCSSLEIEPKIEEIDGSSLFCEIRVGPNSE